MPTRSDAVVISSPVVCQGLVACPTFFYPFVMIARKAGSSVG
jgi:hypothetical protein